MNITNKLKSILTLNNKLKLIYTGQHCEDKMSALEAIKQASTCDADGKDLFFFHGLYHIKSVSESLKHEEQIAQKIKNK